jgi:hypothetical protein
VIVISEIIDDIDRSHKALPFAIKDILKFFNLKAIATEMIFNGMIEAIISLKK